ncbi:hypothetical protein CRM22_001607 [Opisthorchis felineus]|uniref:Uncharacterized protein n=1 Tax=Opisthorchis felineus TaxID=147828 RepID=A0A4V3SGQ8_OPIFE|nr:hypothetical protein CRM22_001607 [Opisthorchis felineus]
MLIRTSVPKLQRPLIALIVLVLLIDSLATAGAKGPLTSCYLQCIKAREDCTKKCGNPISREPLVMECRRRCQDVAAGCFDTCKEKS